MRSSVSFDIVVVGAGPAGIAAACAASESSGSVGLVDDNPAAGGQIWRGEFRNRWFERLRASRAQMLAESRVFDHPARDVLVAERPRDCVEIRYQKLIVATGARERFIPFPGWTLPNVMGAGGLQAMVKCGLPVAGKCVIVAGSGPLLLAVAAYLRKRGAVVPLIVEQTSFRRLARFGISLARHPGKLLQAATLKSELRGTRHLTDCRPVSADGPGKIDVVTLRRGDITWRERCDYLACGFGLVPNLELPLLLGCAVTNGFVEVNEWQETSVAGVYCAGEPTGIGGVDLALIEGEIAGHAAAGAMNMARARFADRRVGHGFARALENAFTLGAELKTLATPGTIVCRCEDVPLSRLRAHTSWRSAKLQTRCGMGACQGRICGPAIDLLLGWGPDSTRPPIFPVRAEHLITREGTSAAGGCDGGQ